MYTGISYVSNALNVDSVVVVSTAADLSGTLDSTKVYLLDGIIDMGSQSIEVPADGLTLWGYSFDVSKLTSSEPNYTMFTSPVGGSGNLLATDIAIEVTGTSSQVFNLVDATGFSAFEFNRVNYNGCTSLGTIDSYRQGLENGTGRFGGQPELTLKGTWVGGYAIYTSIVRGLSDGAYSLFKAGTGFTMNSRFVTNMNADLNTSVALLDFTSANLPNPSTLQLNGCIMARNGVSDSSDTTLIPNIDQRALSSAFSNNVGLPNTIIGGELELTTEVTTTISASSTYYDIAGTWSEIDLQHFDSPANGQLRHLGKDPVLYKVNLELAVEGGANDELSIRIRKWDDSASAFVDGRDNVRQVNSFVGGRDVAFFTVFERVELNQNDYILLQIKNNTDTTNATLELESHMLVEVA